MRVCKEEGEEMVCKIPRKVDREEGGGGRSEEASPTPTDHHVLSPGQVPLPPPPL